ncbi:MAG: polysaccharide biosynthesis C-terminal domain-containing protein [Actinomycetota bacterium]|nr:MAG: polysaccharide biosynthesis protein [Acidimicrobiaceae bacterium]
MSGAGSPNGFGKLRSMLGRLQESGGLARESMWGFTYEGVALVSTIVAFTLLGRTLGPIGYGDYASLYAIVGPLGNLAASGVPLALMQHVVRDKADVESVVRSCLTLTLIFGTALTVLGVVVASLVVPTLGLSTTSAIILLEFVSLPIGSIAFTTVQSIAGYIPATQLRLIPLVIRLAIIVVLSATDRLTVASLGYVYLVVSTVMSLIALQMVANRYRFSPWPGTIRSRDAKTSMQYSLGITGMSFQNDGDKAVLAAYGYREETGLYAAAYRIVQLGLLPVGVLFGVSHQRFLQHQEGERNQHLRRSIKFAAVTASYGLVFAGFVVLIAPVLPRLVGEDFRGSVEMVRWLSPLVLLRSLALFPSNGLMGLGKTFMRSILLVVTAVVSMVLYIVLVPIMNWRGAVLGTMIGEALLAVLAWYFLLRYQRADNDRIDAVGRTALEDTALDLVSEAAGLPDDDRLAEDPRGG